MITRNEQHEFNDACPTIKHSNKPKRVALWVSFETRRVRNHDNSDTRGGQQRIGDTIVQRTPWL